MAEEKRYRPEGLGLTGFKLTPQKYGLALTLITLGIFINPLLIPLTIPYYVYDAVDLIHSLGPEDYCLWAHQNSIDRYAPYEKAFGVIISEFMEQGVKMVFVSFEPWIPGRTDFLINTLMNAKEVYGYEMYEDYVIMPYLSGEESAMASIASSLRGAYKTDYLGKPIEDIPMLEGIDTLTDFSVTFCKSLIGTYWDMYVRQFGAAYAPNSPPILPIGYRPKWEGIYVVGGIDHAPFEQLVGKAAEPLIAVDIQNVSVFLLLGLILYGNIKSLLLTPKERREEAKLF
jgi:hypothetical protein